MAEIIVIGGGISGLMSARELVLRGARVTILERGQIGRESSWAGGGILSPLYPWRQSSVITELCRESQALYPMLAKELLSATGIDPEWTPCGLHVLDAEAGAVSWCDAQLVNYHRHTNGGLWLPDIAHIRNPCLIRALRADLQQRGVTILEQHSVADFILADNRINGVISVEGRTMRADCYVLTAGAWSGQLSALLSRFTLPVQPIKGQMLLFQAEPGVLPYILLNEERYLIPRRDGRILVGSTVEDSGFDKQTTDEARSLLVAFAYRMLPALRDYPIEQHWAGLRPASPEGIPFIDRHPDVANLYYNCGHFRNGFVMAPASARRLAQLVPT